ncbi:MAG: hypothetical protein OHK0029_12650 [Armatimonadaceae bacterium]
MAEKTSGTTGRKQGPPSNIVLIVAVVIALTGMVTINTLSNQLDPKEIERRQQEQLAKQQEEAAKKQQEASTEAVSEGANELVAMGEEAVFGNQKSNNEITLAWSWTPEVQANPASLYEKVEAVKKAAETAAPEVKLRIVNVDANPDQKPGLYIDGKLQMPAQPDGVLPAGLETYAQMFGTILGPKAGAAPQN